MYKKFLIFFVMLGISSALMAGGGGRTSLYFGNTNSLESSLEDNSVTVVYDGSSATVTVADNVADFLTVTPGVRFAEGASGDDQKRVMTPAAARAAGSDYIVVGRPVTGAADPVEAWERCLRDFAG